MIRPINTLTFLFTLCAGIGASALWMPAFAHSLGTDFRSATDLGATTSWPVVRDAFRGTNIVGSLEDRGRVDDAHYFKFQVPSRVPVRIWTAGSTNTHGDLYDSDGLSIEAQGDGGPPGGGNFFIARTLDPGIYYVRVTGVSADHAGSLGPYTLHLDGDASGVATIPLMMSASNSSLQGFVRVVNHSAQATSLGITAVDDTGMRHGPTRLPLSPWQAVHFNSRDLEVGNQSKGIAGVGSGTGNWYLEIAPGHPAMEVLPYVRTGDGFVTGMGNLSPPNNGRQHWVSTFNPGTNRRQVSMLRLIHPMCPGTDCSAANISIVGVDDAGRESDEATLVLQPGEARMVTAQQLEAGDDTLTGALGEGTGKWRLLVTADQAIQVMSLLRSPTGHLSNLSPSAVPHDYTLPSGSH